MSLELRLICTIENDKGDFLGVNNWTASSPTNFKFQTVFDHSLVGENVAILKLVKDEAYWSFKPRKSRHKYLFKYLLKIVFKDWKFDCTFLSFLRDHIS